MAPNGTACLRKSSTASNARNVLKKGPWTVSEDTILVEYVKKHGEGNWNAVQRNSGLMRCGKSCRLRWANHLRPNLKKGAFSAEEERLIVELHAKLGNKWARMAAQLPGRTDNEIKNYWNTRFKRRQRAGLPIYPQELYQENQHLNSSLSSLLALSSNPTNLTSSLCFLDTLKSTSTINHPLQNNPNTSSYTNQELKLFEDNNGGLALSLAASNSSFSASSTMATQPFFIQTLPSVPIPSLLQYNSLNLGFNLCNEMGILELPSIQPSIAATPTPSSSEDYEVEMGFSRGKKSGLLEDLLGESQALNCSEKTEEDSLIIEGIDEGKSTWDFSMIECGEAASNLNERSDVNFVHGSVTATSENNYEGTEKKAEVDGMNCVDDDILNLLDNFPLSVPIPDWNESNPCDCESSNLTNGTNGDIENQPKASTYNPIANSTEAADQERNFGQCFWNNMPSIY